MEGIFILSLLFIFNFSLFAQWIVLNEGPGVNDVIFNSENVGWMTGAKMLLKTEDGGKNWQKLPLHDDWYFTYVKFFDDNIGLAYGFSQTDDYRIFQSERWRNVLAGFIQHA